MEPYFLPSEWAPQSGIMLTWPHSDTDWRPYLDDITTTFVEIAEAILQREDLIVATPHPQEVANLLNSTADDESNACTNKKRHHVRICPCPSNDTWARDHGPITLLGSNGQRQLLDFRFNGWGEKFESEKDNAITRTLYAQGVFNGELVDNDDFVLEGGSIESDGKGTIMTTSFCLMAPNRNQPKSQIEIEDELLRRLHAKRVIWLDHGQLIGDDTDGHIDTIVRFAPDDTLLYASCTDTTDSQYEDFQLLEAQLRNLKTEEGKPYRLIPLPMPRAMFDDQDRLPATYANFLVINGAVLVPTYHQPDLDAKAVKAIASAFPGREMVSIDASTIVRQHGSIHCLTMQLPSDTLRIS